MKIFNILKEYTALTLATCVMNIGIYVFKFPNNFSFGGVSGLSVVLSSAFGVSASGCNLVINMLLILLGFLFLGRTFGIKTVYVSVLSSVGLSLMERFFPMNAPVTDQPMLELIFAILLPALASAVLFNMDASGGGTDILAMILKKYSSVDIGVGLFVVDLAVTVSAFFVFGIETGLYSCCGLMAKSLVIDNVIESINLCKYFTIVTEHPEPICYFIHHNLNRSATIFRAEGSYTHAEKEIILTVMNRYQAVQLRNFIRRTEPEAFMMICNSSEIVGKGFHAFN